MALMIDRRRRGGAALAAGLDAERIGRRQHLGDLGRERRHQCRRAACRNPSASRSAAGRNRDRDRPAPTSPGRRPARWRRGSGRATISGLMQRPTSSIAGIARDRRARRFRDRSRPRRSRVPFGKHRLVHLVVGDDGEAVLERARAARCRAASPASSRKSKVRLVSRRGEAAVVERNRSPAPTPSDGGGDPLALARSDRRRPWRTPSRRGASSGRNGCRRRRAPHRCRR